MKRADGAVQMAKLASAERRIARLHAELAEAIQERARIFGQLAGEGVDPATSRRFPRAHVPVIEPPSELDQARASNALRELQTRRRVGR